MKRLDAAELLKLKEAAHAERRAELGVTEDLIITQKAGELQTVADKGLIKGYASVFEVFDFHNEKTVKGAFKRSIKEDFRGLDVPKIKVLSQHNWTQPIGLPVALMEDTAGLYFEAEISGNADNLPAKAMRALMSEGLVDGVSIGYRIRPGGIVELGEKDFDITQLRGPTWLWPCKLTDLLLMEFSPVTFPSNWEARLEVVKSMGRVQAPGHRFARLPAAPEPDGQGNNGDTNDNSDEGASNKAAPQDDTKSQQQALADALAGFVREDDQRRLADALKTLGG